ncbi:MAG: prephenate dehydrogenase/arogenate dehydrogenase family protein [Gammaproteobacteria bacterium]|jgi:cyclohexadieny/prephenate dehydrogenase / 3-phosphoshikimate 1-carboxyvinyltransferase|nr:prephenate dehydrogenase/arogenate dehydrogenase family protein [Gammaproteobacteria bacterium]MBT5724824.1 prephenate dehydrogenase/arogenate dehydrogenase family protein [Gammaproteobacteria bacterium]
MVESPQIKQDVRRVSVIGLGLIGGSIAAGIKQQGLASSVCAWDPNAASLALGHDLGIIDSIAADINEATAQSDLIVLAVPVQSMEQVLRDIDLKDQVITDVGSVKGIAVEAARRVFGELPENFIPGHPIAGSEKQGVVAADPNLFRQHKVILTPGEASNPAAIARVEKLWNGLGAEVVRMSVSHHDDVLAQTSHLPHLLAYALVDTLSAGGDSLEVFEYAAGGFRDFSRIAASDPTMWSDIFEANKEPLVQVLDQYLLKLETLKQLIESGEADQIKDVLSRAKVARDHFSNIQAIARSKSGPSKK